MIMLTWLKEKDIPLENTIVELLEDGSDIVSVIPTKYILEQDVSVISECILIVKARK